MIEIVTLWLLTSVQLYTDTITNDLVINKWNTKSGENVIGAFHLLNKCHENQYLQNNVFYLAIATPQVVTTLGWLPHSARLKTITLYFTHNFDIKISVHCHTHFYLEFIVATYLLIKYGTQKFYFLDFEQGNLIVWKLQQDDLTLTHFVK